MLREINFQAISERHRQTEVSPVNDGLVALYWPQANTGNTRAHMRTSDELPTVFAQKLGEQCGLLLKMEKGVDHHKMAELRELMRYFQQMAVTSSFEDCVAVYFGSRLSGEKDKDLNDTQLSVLKLIHRTTKPWITGHIVGVLMARIESDRAANKDFAEAVKVLVEQTTTTAEGEVAKGMQGILVKSTRRDAKKDGK